MLTALHIENIAIIDRLDLEFDRGLNILTGETGAGKSIIIDSILLLLGNKASKELIRSGADAGIVSASFCDLEREAIELLSENGLQPDEEGNVAVFRKIGADGRNSARINGVSVTVSLLKELGSYLVNIHGQHDGVLLLDPRRHLGYLDEFALLDELKTKYSLSYDSVKEKRDRLSELRLKEMQKTERLTELQTALKELDDCALREGEYDELMFRRKNLIQNTEITQALQQANDAVYDGEDPAIQQLQRALTALQGVEKDFPQGAALVERLNRLSIDLNDVGAELGKLFDRYASEQMDPNELEERLDQLEAIKKKYGPNDRDVLDRQEAYRLELQELDQGETLLKEAEAAFASAYKELEKSASALSAARKKAGKQMEERLQNELAYLDMPKVIFSVKVQDRLNERGGIRYRANGKDDVEFFLSTNRGETLKPLAKIASGGELSRIMLSIKSVLNRGFDTVIYDEIDTGVSGATAEKIGKKLQAGAEGRQVFCITHLAQIAAMADHHYKVYKEDRDGRTYSTVTRLSERQRVEEVARIMGGEVLSETLLKSAEEILQKAKK